MADSTLGASFSIDITNLKAGLAQANRLIRESESEFKAAAAGMDDWTDSQDGLSARIKSLNNITEIQRKKVDALQREYDNLIKDGLDPTSKKAVELRTKINNETKTLKENEKQLAETEDALSQLNDEKEQSGWDKFKKALKQTGDAAEESADGFTIAKGAISTFIGNGLSKIADAAKNAISSLFGLADSTREYRDDMAKLNTAFGTAGHSTDSAFKAYEDFYAILGESDRSIEALNHLAELTNNEQDLAKWSTIAAGVTAKFGDSLPVEGLTEASNETAKVGQVTGSLSDALNWASSESTAFTDALAGNKKALNAYKRAKKKGLSVEEAFNEALSKVNSEEERAQIITDTLNGIYAEAADEYNEMTKGAQDARRATARMEAAQARLGAKMEPVMTAIHDGVARVVEKFVELVDGVDLSKITDAISTGFSYFIDTVIPAITSGLNWIIDNKDIVIAGIVGIGAAFAAFKVVDIIQSVVNALRSMTLAQAALNLVMKANPIGILISAIAALVAAFIYLWNNCEGFRKFFQNMWLRIKLSFAATVAWFKVSLERVSQFFSDAWTWIQDTWSAAGEWFAGIWESITDAFSSVITWFSDTFTSAWEGIQTAWSTVVEWFTGIWGSITGAFSSVATWFGEQFTLAWTSITTAFATALDWATGVWTDITTAFASVATWFSDTFTTAWTNIEAAFATALEWATGVWNSISSAFSAVATWFGEQFTLAWTNIESAFATALEWATGIWTTISGAFSSASSWFFDTFSSAWSNVKTAFSSVSTFFTDKWKDIKSAFSKVTVWFSTKFTGAWKAIKNVFSGWGDFFTGLWDTISTTFTNLGTTIGDAVSGAVTAGINGILQWVQDAVNGAIGLINGAIDIVNKIPGVDISKLEEIEIPKLASGGYVDEGQLFVAREAGAEMVGSMNGHTAVANNDQIVEGIYRGVYSAVKEAMGVSENGGRVNVYQTNNFAKAHSRQEIYKAKKQTAAAVRLAMGGGMID